MEIRIGDSSYRIARRMNAYVQFDILSRISPLLASGFGEIVPLFMELKRLGITNIAEMDVSRLAAIATPISRELSKMTDADRRFIIGTCLACVDRKKDNEQGWARVWNDAAGVSMFDDINNDAFMVIRIALGVLQETFKGFFPASLSALTGGMTN